MRGTSFLVDENVDERMFQSESSRVIERGGKPGVDELFPLGITKASLSTDPSPPLRRSRDDEGAR